jgi:hypothetical protein
MGDEAGCARGDRDFRDEERMGGECGGTGSSASGSDASAALVIRSSRSSLSPLTSFAFATGSRAGEAGRVDEGVTVGDATALGTKLGACRSGSGGPEECTDKLSMPFYGWCIEMGIEEDVGDGRWEMGEGPKRAG